MTLHNVSLSTKTRKKNLSLQMLKLGMTEAEEVELNENVYLCIVKRIINDCQ